MKRIIMMILMGFVAHTAFASAEIASEDQPFFGTSAQMANCAIKQNFVGTKQDFVGWKYFSEEHR